jgi:hypothetical protein
MLTLTEIEATEADRRERAWRYEQATNEVERCRKQIARLSSQPADADDALGVLTTITDAAMRLPPTVMGTASCRAADQILAVCGAARAQLTTRRDRLQKQLTDAQAALVKAEAYLTTIEQEATRG